MKYDNLPEGESLTYRELFALPDGALVRDADDSGTLKHNGEHRGITWDDGCISGFPSTFASRDDRSGVWACGSKS